ncbi:MAG TPA: AAA family ATPase, partial [Pseudonocardia sp.]|nr:AAA family ATPase [Pseudonocardia sp.]
MTESENRPEVTEDGGTAGSGVERPGRTGVTRPAGRRPVSILPWEAAEPSPETPARSGGRPPARRAPVPPSDLLSAPAPANRTGADDPFASLPPWLPPVRRPTPPRPPRTARPATPGQRPNGVPGAGGYGGSPVPRGPLGPPRQPPGPHTPTEGWAPPTQRPSYPRAVEPPALPRPIRPDSGGESGIGFAADPGLPVEPVIGLAPPPAAEPATPAPHTPTPHSTPTPAAAPNTAAPTASTPAAAPPRPTPAALAPVTPAAPARATPAPPPAKPKSAPPLPIPLDPAVLERVEPRRRLTADSIRHEQVVTPDQQVPQFGWRATVYAATGGRINLGIGAAERDWLDLLQRVRAPLAGARQIAVMSIKGGVGKTTVAACLGLMLAEYRGDGVVAVDADPDAGTLADRLSGAPTVTVRDLLDNLDTIKSLSHFTEYTSLAGRLRVLAGEQDPAMGEAFQREEYERVCRALARYFDIVITDSGTGLVHSTMRGTLELADRLIVVGSP